MGLGLGLPLYRTVLAFPARLARNRSLPYDPCRVTTLRVHYLTMVPFTRVVFKKKGTTDMATQRFRGTKSNPRWTHANRLIWTPPLIPLLCGPRYFGRTTTQWATQLNCLMVLSSSFCFSFCVACGCCLPQLFLLLPVPRYSAVAPYRPPTLCLCCVRPHILLPPTYICL